MKQILSTQRKTGESFNWKGRNPPEPAVAAVTTRRS